MIRPITLFFAFIFMTFGYSQNGKLLSKETVDLSKTPFWSTISEDNQLLPEFDHLKKLDFFFITYESDGLKVKGILIEPKEAGIYPVVIFNRGGNRTFAPLTVATMIMYTSKLAEQGYVIIGSNYREKDEFGGAEINDVLNLIETVKEIKKVDANCIGMYGWSRGGMMTYLALQKSTRITSAIIGNAPTDLFGTIIDRPEMETKVFAECIPNYNTNKVEELKKRSAIYWPEQLYKHTSLLILSGTNDDRVNPNQVEKLSVKLKALDHDFQLIRYETDHFFTDKKVELNQTVIGWFNRELKGKKI